MDRSCHCAILAQGCGQILTNPRIMRTSSETHEKNTRNTHRNSGKKNPKALNPKLQNRKSEIHGPQTLKLLPVLRSGFLNPPAAFPQRPLLFGICFPGPPGCFRNHPSCSPCTTTAACGRHEAAGLSWSSSSAVGESPEVTLATAPLCRLCSESLAEPVWLLRRRWLRSWTGAEETPSWTSKLIREHREPKAPASSGHVLSCLRCGL